MPKPSRHHETIPERPSVAPFSPARGDAPSTARLDVGESSLEVSCDHATAVCIRFGGSSEIALLAPAGDVTHWCAETSVLLEVTLAVASGDELQIRSPMLVGADGRCMSIVRRVTDAGSELSLVVAASPTSMQRDSWELALGATRAELMDLLAALRGASGGAGMPDDTKSTDSGR